MVGDLEDAASFIMKQQPGKLPGANCSNPSVSIVMTLICLVFSSQNTHCIVRSTDWVTQRTMMYLLNAGSRIQARKVFSSCKMHE